MPHERNLATGSIAGEQIKSAGVRACDAHRSVRRACERINEELDDVTSPGVVQVGGLGEEDSMVVAVAEVIEAASGHRPAKAANGKG